MREHRSKIVVVALLVLIVGVPFLLRPAVSRTDAQAAAGEAERLIVITPHNEQIRYELARAFNEKRAAEGRPRVVFDWRASGGTSDLRKNVLSQFQALGDRGEEANGIGIDLFWGGGDYEHNQLVRGPVVNLRPRDEDGRGTSYALDRTLLPGAMVTLRWTLTGGQPGRDGGAAGGVRPTVRVRLASPEARIELRPATGVAAEETVGSVTASAAVREADGDASVEVRVRNGGDEPVTLGGIAFHAVATEGFASATATATLSFPVTVPADVPDALLREAFPEPTIGGEPLYHQDRYWVGVVLASFGIVYNNDLLEMIDAPTPTSWQHLAAPQFRGWVALADPAHSGSVATTYNVILRRMGWEEGWTVLREVCANARYFTSSASKVPVDVSAGEAAAGMCIDFYGRFQAGAVASAGADRVGYADPPFLTATTADPIGVLRGAPHEALANEFVRFLLSAEAQRLWQRRVGTPGGPERFELRRLPIRRDLYTPAEAAHWTDPEADPWTYARPFPEAMPSFQSIVGPLAHAMAIDVHRELVAAWTAILDTPRDHPRLAEMLATFQAMPDDLKPRWPDAELRGQWQLILDEPSHRRHGDVAETLGAFSDSLGRITRDPDLLLEKRVAWTRFFRRNYERVVTLAGE